MGSRRLRRIRGKRGLIFLGRNKKVGLSSREGRGGGLLIWEKRRGTRCIEDSRKRRKDLCLKDNRKKEEKGVLFQTRWEKGGGGGKHFNRWTGTSCQW